MQKIMIHDAHKGDRRRAHTSQQTAITLNPDANASPDHDHMLVKPGHAYYNLNHVDIFAYR